MPIEFWRLWKIFIFEAFKTSSQWFLVSVKAIGFFIFTNLVDYF